MDMISSYDNYHGDESEIIAEIQEREEERYFDDSWKYNMEIMETLFGEGYSRRACHE
jgi:hypothetical protein